MVQISESTPPPTKASGARWLATLITPGKGSSGVYSEETLRSTGPAAFPKGTHSYIGHPTDGTRNPRDLFATLESDAYYEDGVGLRATLKIVPHFQEFADSVAEHTGLSIYASAERVQDPQTGDWVVESILPAVDNSVDLVSYPGRGGGLTERLLESARSTFDKTSSFKEADGTAPADSRTTKGKEKVSMEIDELATRVDSLAESVTALAALVGPLAESLTAEKEKAALEAAEADKAPELDFAAIAEAAIAAGLPEAARKVVYEQVRLGAVPVAEAIEAQKGLVESIKKSVSESLGAVVRVGTDSVNQDFMVARWKTAVNN